MDEQDNIRNENASELEADVDDADGMRAENITPKVAKVTCYFLAAAIIFTAGAITQKKYHWIEKTKDYITQHIRNAEVYR
jgi:hypothetical protein